MAPPAKGRNGISLARAAWELLAAVVHALAGLPDVVPGSLRLRIVSVQEKSYEVVILAGIPAVDAEEARSKVLERILSLPGTSP